MARNRQRSKQRQADRRAARLAARGGDGQARDSRLDEVAPSAGDREAEAELAAGAPPEEVGRSDEVIEHPEPPAPDLRGTDAEDEEAYFEERPLEGDSAGVPSGVTGEPEYEPRGRRGPDRAEEKERGRVLAFLAAVVAELKRVQWPDRKATTTLTGVVLGFVLIAGGYLGLLDAIFSRVIQAIL
jgi:preprotein translocase SecE subunit